MQLILLNARQRNLFLPGAKLARAIAATPEPAYPAIPPQCSSPRQYPASGSHIRHHLSASWQAARQ